MNILGYPVKEVTTFLSDKGIRCQRVQTDNVQTTINYVEFELGKMYIKTETNRDKTKTYVYFQ